MKLEKSRKSYMNSIFVELITVAFVVLRLLNIIDWSWWWVLSPLWIPCGLAILALIIIWVVSLTKR